MSDAINITDDVLDLTGTTQDIENDHISDNTKKTYMRSLIQLIVYLFDNYQELLSFIGPLIIANDKDTQRKGKTRMCLQKEYNKQLDEMNRTNKKSPIKIIGETCLIYEIISTFANTKKRTAFVRKDLLREVIPDCNFDENEGSEKVEVSVWYSDSVYQSITSAVAFLYR